MITYSDSFEVQAVIRRLLLNMISAREELNCLIGLLYDVRNQEAEIGIQFKLKEALSKALTGFDYHTRKVEGLIKSSKKAVKEIRRFGK